MDYKIIVDAGHGGSDPGALGNNLKEKDLTLRAALYINKRLNELGINSVLTRDSDISLPKDERIRKIRGLIDNSAKNILISNHINAGGAEGAEVVYALKNTPIFAELILNNIGDSGQKTRKIYQRRLPENPNKDYYYIIRETGNVEPVLIEYGFIDNINDSNRLNKNIEKYAEAVVKAIAEYIGVAYSEKNDGEGNNNLDFYIVQPGDTLYSIARKNGVSVTDIKNINSLTSDVLSIGQKLYLKSIDNGDNKYIVNSGDTLYSIARKYGVSVDDLISSNNLYSNVLTIGQELIIPVVEMEDPNDENIDNNYSTYIVEKGDSLWKIAGKYNIPVQELINLNNLSNLTLQIGQELIVPNTNTEEYIVISGDTLWKIAKLYGIDVNDLKLANNLSSNLLSVGQKLIIPKNS